tara:strand:+ start:7224 stop:7436 length:213 start_codon:yes stop_codon:yes gene_type:complete
MIKEAVENILKEALVESWMDDDDWKEFLKQIETQLQISVESLVADIEVGISNGYTLEYQLDVARKMLTNL